MNFVIIGWLREIVDRHVSCIKTFLKMAGADGEVVSMAQSQLLRGASQCEDNRISISSVIEYLHFLAENRKVEIK
jgi:hypothetical protein